MDEQNEVLDAVEPQPKTTALAEYTAIDAALADVTTRYKGVAFNLRTVKGDKEARQARKELVTLRTAIETARKTGKAPLLERIKSIDEAAKTYTAEVLKLEKPIDDQIKADEERREAERQAREKAEAERLAAIQLAINAIASIPAQMVGKSAADIDAVGSSVFERELDPAFFGDQLPRAEAAKQNVLVQLTAMVTVAEQREAAEKLAAEQAAELARLRAEKAEADRIEAERRAAEEARLAAERAEQERLQREAAEAKRREDVARSHIAAIYQRAATLGGATSKQLSLELANLDEQPDLGPLNGELQSAVNSARLTLESMLSKAEEAERAQAEAQAAIKAAAEKAEAERKAREAAEAEERAKREAIERAERAAAAAAEAARKALLSRAEQKALEMFQLLEVIDKEVLLSSYLSTADFEAFQETMAFIRGEA